MANTQGIRAGRAFVELGVSDKLTRGLKRAQARLKAFGAGVRSIGMRLATIGASLAAPLLASVKVFAAAGDQLDKMSRRTGLSAESLSELGFAAEQSGTNLETLEKGMRTLQRSINDAGRGLSTAVDALSDLGLTYEDLRGLSPEQQFKLVAERLNRIEDPSKRAALAMMLLGRAGTQLLPMMQDGARGIEELQQQARELGLTISSEAAADAAKLTDTLNILWRVVKQGVFVIGSALADTIIDLAKTVTHVVVRVTEWVRQNKALVVIAAKVVVGIMAAGAALIILGTSIAGIAAAVGGLASVISGVGVAFSVLAGAIAALLSPIGLVVAAVAGLGTAVAVYTGAAGSALEWLSEQFGRLRDFVGTVVGGIVDALAAGDIALAAKVLWAGLKLAWETGIQPLRKAWNAFRFAFERIGIEAFAGVKKGWIEVSDWLWKNFPETTAFIAKTWANLGATLRNVWARFQNWLSDRWLEVMGMFDESLDVELAKSLGREDLEGRLAEIEQERQDAVAEAKRKAKRTDAEREAEKAAALAEVEEQRAQALDRLQQEHADRIKAAEDALAAAKAELAGAREKARQKRAEAEDRGAPSQRQPGDVLAGLEDRLKEVGDTLARKISVTGAFNPMAVWGLGGASAIERTAKATETTAKNTGRLVEAATTGGLAFA